MKKSVLVVGSGAREHALARALVRDDVNVLIAPGNAGTTRLGRNLSIPVDDVPALVSAAESTPSN